jgi:uncharacterized protein YqgC (DUF456 family)
MDIIIILSIVSCLLLLGVIGSVVPVVPGPLMSFIALLIVHFFTEFTFSNTFVMLCAIASLLVFLSDYFLQYFGVKQFGGGKRAVYGTFIGVFIGLFIPPIGLLIGPFLGAFMGSLMDSKKESQAFKIALGSLIAFLFGSFIKFIFSLYMIYIIFEKILF